MSAQIHFEDWEAEQKQDPEFQAAVEEQEPIFQTERLKLLDRLSTAYGKTGQVRT